MSFRTWRDPLAGTRPAFMPNPSEPVDPARRERELRAILDEPRPAGARPPRRLRLVAVSAAGVVAAAIVVATTTTSDAPGTNPAESPRQVLLAVADAAAEADVPTSGRYWHVRTRGESVRVAQAGPGHGAYLVRSGAGMETWSPRTGTDENISLLNMKVTTHPLTARDKAEWDKAGNPVGGFPDAPVPPPADVLRWTGETTFVVGGLDMQMRDTLALPTDAEQLKAWLLDRFHADPRLANDDETEWLAQEANNLLARAPTTPGTRAAAYRMLAGLPGYRVMDATELPDGSMVGVARKMRTSWERLVANGVIELQLIIDPDTGQLHTERLMLLEPGTEARPLPAGTVFNSMTVEHIGWVDTDPVVPPGAEDISAGPGK